MRCPVCEHSNDDRASFCSACGSGLARTCPQCDTPYSSGDAFCSTCGHKLEDGSNTATDPLLRYLPAELLAKLNAARTSRTMAGERRQVTMLFADLQGSTAAAEQLDPEDWADVVNGAFERLIRPVYRFEGTLARLMGDAVLAFFGAPIAHEDDPERAIRAGLAMLHEIRPYAVEAAKRWGVQFDLRVGINTGLVVVGEVGSDLRVEYTALGDAVNVAARMEQVAEPGTLLVSEDTHRLVPSLFEFEALDPVTVKGKSEPVSVFRVTGTRDDRSATRGLPGRTASLIGRDDELATLRSVADEVRGGRGQIATVIGEAGVGKSRLTAALKEALSADDCVVSWSDGATGGNRIRWAEARCLSYNTAVAYAPFIDLFSRALGITPDDDDMLGREKVVAAVDASGVDESGRVATYLCVLLGIDPGGTESGVVAGLPTPALQRRVFSAVVDYLRGCAEHSPVLLVVEDLHWADSVSLALLEELLQATDRSTMGVIALMRPYRDDSSWRFHETAQRSFSHRYTPIHLEPLDGDAATRLLRELTDADLTDEITTAVLQRAEGNPFFVEELVRNLMEDGGSGSAIPTNVSALLTSRIDRLEGGSKLVVQFASVFGREFEFGELSALVGDVEETETALSDLLSRDLIVERTRIPEREYAFRHALIQETAYSTILLKERRSLHGQVAAHLEGRSHDPQEMARHLIESQQETKAVPYLLVAAEQAARSMNLHEAIRLFDQVLTWVPTDDTETLIRAHDGLGSAYSLIPDLTKAAGSYQRMLEVGKERSAPSIQVTALNRLGSTTAFLSGDIKRAVGFLEDARRLAEEAGDEMGLAEYHMTSCMIATHTGDLAAAADHDAETARIGSATGSERVRIGGLVQRAQSLVYSGKFEEGRTALEHARRAAEGVADPDVQSNLAATQMILHMRDGELVEAWTLARATADLASSVGSPSASIIGGYAGMIATQVGYVEDALAYYADAARFAEELGQPFIIAASAAAMAHIYAELGIEGPDVEALRVRAVEHLGMPMGTMLASGVHADLGWAAIARHDVDVAVEHFGAGVAGTSAVKLLANVPLLLGLALTRLIGGDLEGAAALVTEANDFVEAKNMAFLRPFVAFMRGRLAMAAGEDAAAIEILAAGAGLADGMGAEGISWRIHATHAGALRAAGRDSDAAMAEAHRIVDGIASRFADPALRDAFAASARAAVDTMAGVPAG